MLTPKKKRPYLYGEKNNDIFINRLQDIQYRNVLLNVLVMRETIDDLVK